MAVRWGRSITSRFDGRAAEREGGNLRNELAAKPGHRRRNCRPRARAIAKIHHPRLCRLRSRQRRTPRPGTQPCSQVTDGACIAPVRAATIVEPAHAATTGSGGYHLHDRHTVGAPLQQLVGRDESFVPHAVAGGASQPPISLRTPAACALGLPDRPGDRRRRRVRRPQRRGGLKPLFDDHFPVGGNCSFLSRPQRHQAVRRLAVAMRSMSQGRANYTMEFAKYMEVPTNVADAVMKKAS